LIIVGVTIPNPKPKGISDFNTDKAAEPAD